MRLCTLSALGLVALLGCSKASNTTPPPTTDGGSTAVGRSCNVDAECNGLRCDPVRRTCICLSDSDCPALADGGPQYCSNFTGLCVASVPGCHSDADCGSAQFCNPETRGCQDLRGFCQTCAVDAECGPNNHCLADSSLGQSFCTKACSTPADCPQGTTCTQLGAGDSQCLPSPGSNCKTFTGCTPDSLKSCDQNSDCADSADDQVCDTGSGLCRARVQICPLGTVCDPSVRVCVSSCSVDRDCSSDGSLACVNHLCQPLSSCQSDADCPTDKVCDVPPGAQGGNCVPFCTSDTSCGVGRVCQPVVEPDGSTRQSCLPGCVHNSDCPPNQVCVDPGSGQLFVQSGTALGQCSSTLNGAQACQSTDACGTCQLCASSNTCQGAASLGYCHPCDPQRGNADCNAYAIPNSPFTPTCLSLAGRDSSGNIISSGPYACGIPCTPGGTADQAECPKGFVCAAILDSNGNGTGNYNCVPANFDCGLGTGETPKCQ